MSNSSAGSLDRTFEELIQRVVERTIESVRTEMGRLASSAAPASPAPVPPAASGAVSALNQAINSILAPTTQTEIMAAALRAAALSGGAAGLFVRRGDAFSSWRSEGLAAEAANSLRGVGASATSSGAFKDICDSQQPICLPRNSASWPAGLDLLASNAGASEICLVPIVVIGKVVAAVAASGANGSDTMAALEIIGRVTGLSLETSGARSSATQSAPAGQPSAATAAIPAAAPAAAAVEAPAASQPIAAAPVAPTGGSFADAAPAAVSPSPLPPPPDIESLPEEDKESHRKAHRFARVAVQDLLSYHKNKIAEGRNNRNLYEVLREDIDKTRENYQRKFAQTAAASFDYLHYEMIGKLAGNDPEILGAQYPGPVSA